MDFNEIKPGMRVQIINESKWGRGFFLKQAKVLSTIHEDSSAPCVRILLLDGSGTVMRNVAAADLDYE